MPWSRPSLADLYVQARQAFAARLSGISEQLRRSSVIVVSKVLAGLTDGEYGYLDWMVRQLLPDTAEESYLDRWCAIFNVARRGAAAALGNVVFQGIDGVTVPAGLQITTGNSGQVYATAASGVIAGGSVTIAVEAILGGADDNQPANTPVVLMSAVAGVNGSAAFDAAGATGGLDEEGDDSLRARLLLRIRQPPQGGAKSDYEQWALAALAGVTRAWPLPLNRGAGTCDVTFVMDGRGDIIPTSDDVAAVQAYIDGVRPVTADVIVFAPAATPLNLTIAALSPATDAVKAAIGAEVADLLAREAVPAGTIYYSHLDEAISAAVGEGHHFLASPSGDVTAATGHIFVLGTITYP